MGPSKKKLKANTMENSNCKIRVVVDCSFDELMTDKVWESVECYILIISQFLLDGLLFERPHIVN